MNNELIKQAKETAKTDFYEAALGVIFKMQVTGSIVAGEALNKHNPKYLSELIKEQSYAEEEQRPTKVGSGCLHSKPRYDGGQQG